MRIGGAIRKPARSGRSLSGCDPSCLRKRLRPVRTRLTFSCACAATPLGARWLRFGKSTWRRRSVPHHDRSWMRTVSACCGMDNTRPSTASSWGSALTSDLLWSDTGLPCRTPGSCKRSSPKTSMRRLLFLPCRSRTRSIWPDFWSRPRSDSSALPYFGCYVAPATTRSSECRRSSFIIHAVNPFSRRTALAEAHVICALRDKRSELAGMVNRLERELVERRASLTHLDATMRLFDPDLRPEEIRPRRLRDRNAWFRPGECLRLIYDVLRHAPKPLTARELAERIMDAKPIPAADDR